jgi:preprotein translocase subunit SecE
MANFMKYARQSFKELTHNVTWPNSTELQQTTVLVLVFSLLLGALIYGIDMVWSYTLTFLY